MVRGSGIALKTLQWFLRAVEFCCAAVVLAIFSYFLAKLSINHVDISSQLKAVEGISGIAICYTIIAVLLVCFIGGFGFFAFLAFILDIAFVGGFIYIAYENRSGASSCTGNVNTPFGSGDVSTTTTGSLPTLRTGCKMQTASFAVSIVAILFFLLSALVEIALWRHHKSEKKYGPGPANGYTAGSGSRKFWQRRNRNVDATMASGGIGLEKPNHINSNSLPTHATPSDARASYQTDNTMVSPESAVYNKYAHAGNGGVANTYTSPAAGHVGTGYGETAHAPLGGYQTTGVTGVSELSSTRY